MKIFVLTLALLFCCGTINSQTPEEMKAWESNMTPGEQHKMISEMDGYWNAKVSMWMDPSQPPSVSDATSKNEMIMNGLYQRTSHTGNMMGMPFHGESITGYDKIKKQFFSTWIDNMGSGIMMMKGTYDEASKKLTMTGTMTDPMTGNDMNIKNVTTFTSPDENMFEMFMVVDGKDVKNMEIVYTRAKD